jgi:hypothetical protein
MEVRLPSLLQPVEEHRGVREAQLSCLFRVVGYHTLDLLTGWLVITSLCPGEVHD